MSVISSLDESIKANGVDTYDSGDDWEIGLGNLIINLDADLEKDQRKLEMNRVLSIKSSVKRCEDLAYSCATTVLDGLTNPSAQPSSVARGNACKESKKLKVKKSNSSNVKDKIVSLDTLYGIPKVCIGKRQESQGRLREATEMNSATDQENSKLNTSDVTISCAKGKEEKRGKNHSRTLKRERDTVRTRKEKQGDAPASLDFSGVRASENDCAVEGEENPCHCEDGEMGDSKGGVGARIMGSAIVVNKIEEIDAPARTQKTVRQTPWNIFIYSLAYYVCRQTNIFTLHLSKCQLIVGSVDTSMSPWRCVSVNYHAIYENTPNNRIRIVAKVGGWSRPETSVQRCPKNPFLSCCQNTVLK